MSVYFRTALVCAIIALAVALVPQCALAQAEDLQQQAESCGAELGGAHPISADAKVAACTALIRSGKLSAREMSTALVLRSEAYGGKGDLAAKFRDLDDAVKADPGNGYAWAQSCSAQMWIKHNTARAMTECTKAIQLEPALASGWTHRGDIFLNARKYDKAIADYDYAIKLDPTWMWPWDNRGEAYLRSGKVNRAIQDFDEVIAIAPDYAMGYLDRGIAQIRNGDLKAALADFESGLKVDPNCGDCLFGRGVVKTKTGDATGAAADFASAKKLDPKAAEYFETFDVRLAGP